MQYLFGHVTVIVTHSRIKGDVSEEEEQYQRCELFPRVVRVSNYI